jgi:hypothetical protein
MSEEEDTAPALPEAVVASPANCIGTLVELPGKQDTYYNYYDCQTCHQVVLVAREYLAENGLPPEHSPIVG